jgi:hypothetical protein
LEIHLPLVLHGLALSDLKSERRLSESGRYQKSDEKEEEQIK